MLVGGEVELLDPSAVKGRAKVEAETKANHIVTIHAEHANRVKRNQDGVENILQENFVDDNVRI